MCFIYLNYFSFGMVYFSFKEIVQKYYIVLDSPLYLYLAIFEGEQVKVLMKTLLHCHNFRVYHSRSS